MAFPNHLNIAITPAVDLFIVNTSVDGTIILTGGQEKAFFEILAEKLAFSFRFLIPEDTEWGLLTDNGTWTGMIGLVHRNEADLAIGKIAYTLERSLYIRYSYPYAFEELVFSSKAPGYLPTTASFLYPFSLRLWFCIFCLLILMSAIFYLILSKRYSVQKSVLMVFSHLLNKPYSVKTVSYSDRCVILFWMLGAITIAFSYTALLLSFLTVPLKEPTIETIEELSNVLEKGSYKCYTFKGATFAKTIQESKMEFVSSIGYYIDRNNWYVDHKKEIMMEYLSQPSTAIIAPESDFELLNRHKLFISSDPFSAVMFAIVLNKQFCCKKTLDSVLRRITEAGIYKKLEQDYYFRIQLQVRASENCESSDVQSLDLSELYGVFILLLLGYVLSLVCFFTEYIYHKIMTKKEKE